jgi:hypothetical protein
VGPSHLSSRERLARATVHPFAAALLRDELPELAPARRDAACDFTIRRVISMPSVTRFGVLVIASAMRAVLTMPGGRRAGRWLSAHPLPLIGEYPRLIRSLTFAYIWETWPDTRASGAAA